MEKERINYLLRQFMSDALAAEEQEELTGIMQEDPEQVQDVVVGMLEHQAASPVFDNARWEGMLQKILAMDKPSEEHARSKRVLTRRRSFRWAAAAAILIGGGIWLWLSPWPGRTHEQIVRRHQDILPGDNKAALILGDGSRVILGDMKNGELLSQGNTIVNKTGKGEVVYQTAASNEPPQVGAITYNTLLTPRGGQYRVILPDGTRVWLNAASSLKYPTAFTGAERTVELNGEAYFEVTEDKHIPFRVKITGGGTVEVFGTRFNVMAYDDEESIQATLLEGSIALTAGTQATTSKSQEPRNSQLLKPGQQGRVSRGARVISVVEVNAADAVAWKNGYFAFSGEPIQRIMRKIARWYDVEVEYKGAVTGERFNGSISRFEQVSDVLDMLELTGLVSFKMDGRRIIVMP